MKELWNRFEKWLLNNKPELLELLNDGANEMEIKKLEKRTKLILPEEFKDFLRIHNGQKQEGTGLFGDWGLLSTHEILDVWENWAQIMKNLVEDNVVDSTSMDDTSFVKDIWWNKKWIPFNYDGSGNFYCIDLDPGEKGTVGQIIVMWHDDAERPLKAKNFTELFERIVENLESGKYGFDPDYPNFFNDEFYNMNE